MRRTAIAACLLSTTAAFAARAQAIKIGYVDVQRAIQETDEGKGARSRLKGEFEQRRLQIDKKSADLEKMQQDYEKQAPVLSDDAKKKKQEEFQKALFDARKQANDLQEDMGRKEQEAMATILQKLTQVVAEIAEREQLTFVMEKSSLLYGPQAADITNEVVRRYNDRFGGAGGKAAAKTSQPQKPPQQPQQKPQPQQQQQPPQQQPPPPGNK